LLKDPTLLVVEPPGTNKISLCQRISPNSVCDKAQLYYYVASSRGSVIQVHKASCVDSVILLNESDKIGQRNIHGDPSTALLEVLDLEQNWNFYYDHINVQLIYIKIYSFIQPVFSTLYLHHYSIDVK